MVDEQRAELQDRIALLEARLAAQQELLETETRRRIALEEALEIRGESKTPNNT